MPVVRTPVGASSQITRPRPGLGRSGNITRVGRVGTSVKILGVREAIAKLRVVGQTVYRDTGLICYRSAQAITKKAKQRAPKGETGVLEDSIHAEKRGVYDWAVVASTRDQGADREYAGYQEFGWHDRAGNWHEGRRYMRDSAAEQGPETQKMLVALALKVERM